MLLYGQNNALLESDLALLWLKYVNHMVPSLKQQQIFKLSEAIVETCTLSWLNLGSLHINLLMQLIPTIFEYRIYKTVATIHSHELVLPPNFLK